MEERLRELGVEVKRPLRVVGMKDSGEGKGTDILFESGETVRSKYVIGADGARSMVSTLVSILRLEVNALDRSASCLVSTLQIRTVNQSMILSMTE